MFHEQKRILDFANLVVYNIFQGNAKLIIEVVEELLVEDEGDAGDLLDVTLRLRVPVYKVDCDRDSQLAPELFPPETLKEVGIFSSHPSKL